MYNKSTDDAKACANGEHSEWRWPVPFLFGGFTAMVVLIAFAVVVLARSYWKEQTDPNIASDELAEISVEDIEQKVVVIMAGNETPTFFANPASSKFHDLEIKI